MTTAITLKVKMVEIAYETSASEAAITASVAAMADAPQIPVPTPIRVRRSRSIDRARPRRAAPTRATAREPSRTGNEDTPVLNTSCSESPVPRTTIEPCRTNLEEKRSPGRTVAGGAWRSEMPIPPSTATTGAPTTGTRWPMTMATAARAAARVRPGTTARASKAKPEGVSLPGTSEDVGVVAGSRRSGTRGSPAGVMVRQSPRVGEVVIDEHNITSGAIEEAGRDAGPIAADAMHP